MLSVILVVSLLYLFSYITGKYFLSATGNLTGLDQRDLIIVGTALINTFFTIYSVFLPTNVWSVGILGIIIILIILILKYQKAVLMPVIEWRNWKLFIPFAVLVCLLAADGPRNSDSIQYHISAIGWIENYAVVPGLGNLHGRLAFNPNIFNLMAGFSFKDVAHQSLYAVNAFFSIVFFSYLFELFNRRHKFQCGTQLFFMITGILSVQYMLLRLSSPTPDLLAGLLPVYVFLRFIDFNMSTPDPSAEQKRSFLFLITLIAAYVITIKLSSLFLMLLPLLMVWKFRDVLTIQKIAIGVSTCLLLFVPWLVRNYYLSGYLIFPANEFDFFNPDWKIPGWAVNREKLVVYNWAKWSTSTGLDNVATMKLSEWVPVWYSNVSSFWKLFLPLCLFSPLTVFISYWKNRGSSWSGEIFKLWAVCFSGVLFWFFTAPDPRFGYPFIIFSALACLLFWASGPSSATRITRKIATVSGILFLLVCFLTPLKVIWQVRSNLPNMLIKPLPFDYYGKQMFQLEMEAARMHSYENIRIDQEIYPLVYKPGQRPSFSPLFIESGDLFVPAPLLFRGESVEEGFTMAELPTD